MLHFFLKMNQVNSSTIRTGENYNLYMYFYFIWISDGNFKIINVVLIVYENSIKMVNGFLCFLLLFNFTKYSSVS